MSEDKIQALFTFVTCFVYLESNPTKGIKAHKVKKRKNKSRFLINKPQFKPNTKQNAIIYIN
ncbi:CLUMA_CG012456, isoform A [Clunio marinus]|uniref:CLUMA_CG012456, isoform A n=1 Tax=Clunio marinus TaxID=568069 RepID=A0A1J1IFP1_9DIPT|nr:CLUMA_CG012456, isoform A [Clunio marinus]